MQISIENHDAVTTGLATELGLVREQLEAAKADLEAARGVIDSTDKAGAAIGDLLVSEKENCARKLDRIRMVALGHLQEITPSDEPEWTTALAHVENLAAMYRRTLTERDALVVQMKTYCKTKKRK